MTLSALIHGKSNVAKVASVAVANQLFPEEESAIRAWLVHIEETEPIIITEVIEKCRDEPEARRYFLKCSQEVQP